MRRLIVGVVAMTVGCVEPSHELHCGQLLCPDSEVCIENMRCVDRSAITACDGIDPNGACEAAGTKGFCIQHGDNTVCDPSFCGDGRIDDRVNEQCDGNASFAAQCVDLGYDLGRLGCTDRCEFDPAPCRRFGWETIVNAPVFAMWTDGQVLVYAQYSPPSLHATGAGYNVDVAAQVPLLAGGGGRVVVAGDVGGHNGLYEVHPTGVDPFAAPMLVGTVALLVDDGGGVYTVMQQGIASCHLAKANGTAWVFLANVACGSTDHYAVASAANSHRLFHSTGTQACEMLGGTTEKCVDVFPGGKPIAQLAVRDAGSGERVYVANGASAVSLMLALTTPTVVVSQNASTLAFSGSFVYTAANGTAWRSDGSALAELRAPASVLADDGNRGVYAYGGPIYRYSGMTFGELQPTPLDAGDAMIASFDLATGHWFASNQRLFQVARDESWTAIPGPLAALPQCGSSNCPMRAMFGLSTDDFVVASYDDMDLTTPMVWIGKSLTVKTDLLPMCATGSPHVDGLWMPSAGIVFAAGVCDAGHGFLARWENASWANAATDGCELHAVTGRGPGNVIAGGACNGRAQLWHYDGASWTAPADESFADIAGPFYAVATFQDGTTFAVGDYGAAWCVAAECTAGQWHTDPTVTGRSISGTENDLWIAGAFTAIQRWDGTGWSKMTTQSLTQTVLHATPNRVLMPGGAPGHVSLLRDP